MNSRKYNFLRLSLIILGLLPSVFSLFLVRRKKRVTICSEFNTEFNHNSKYLFLYFLEENLDLDVRFVINDSNRRKKLSVEFGDYFISSFSLRGLWFIHTSYTWITSSLETPVSGIFLSFRRKVIHLGHGAPLKNIGLGECLNRPIKKLYYRLIRTNFSHFLSTCESFDSVWQRCLNIPSENVIRSPQARNDKIINPSDLAEYEERTTVLYAPTWRPYSPTNLFPFVDFSLKDLERFLIENNVFMILRLHPNFGGELVNRFSKIKNITISSKSEMDDINETLGSYDLLITDYSSIYIDFLLTEKPVIFLPYDIDDYKKTIGFSVNYDYYTPGPKPDNFETFKTELLKLIKEPDYFLELRKEINSILNPQKENHAEGCAKAVLSLICKDTENWF